MQQRMKKKRKTQIRIKLNVGLAEMKGTLKRTAPKEKMLRKLKIVIKKELGEQVAF